MKPNPEHFECWPNESGLNLIIPKHGTAGLGNGPWNKDTIQFRSRMETPEGETVSQGFKKFFNLGTGPESLQISVDDVVKECGKGAVATLKLDGSLLIRSVFKGKVILRTRGSHSYERLANAAEMDIFRYMYPNLFLPFAYTNYSLLFEWVSPDNVIVLKYPEPALTLIGGVWNHSLRYLTIKELAPVANLIEVPLVEHFNLTTEGWDKLNARLESDQEIEGYVIRLHGEQDLVKVKCLPYLTKHGLKSSLTTEKLADMWFQQGQPDYEIFKLKFIADFDEETFLWAHGAISSLFDGAKEFIRIIEHMGQKAAERRAFTQKDAALAGIAEYGQTKRFAVYMNLWQGKPVKVELLKSILLQNIRQVELGMFTHTEQGDALDV